MPAAKCRLAQRLLLMSMAVCSSPAWADDVAVAPGGRTVIATSATEITKPSAHSPEARVAVLQDGPSWILLYTPDPSTADNRDLVSWIADAKPVTQAVRVLADAGGNVYGGSAKALFALFAIAIVLESGLALIFTWRPFLTTFNSRAVKPLVSLGVAFLFVRSFRLDIVSDLVGPYVSVQRDPSALGYAMTALVVAGGSSGVNRLMQAVGIRPVRAVEIQAQRPSPTMAWLSVRAQRRQAVGDITVLVASTGPAGPVEFVMGIIKQQGAADALRRFFLRDLGRAPPEGGHALSPGEYRVRLIDSSRTEGAAKWGPYGLAAGSIIDVELEF